MVNPDATALRYTHVAIILHWTIAALIIFNLATGFFVDSIPDGLFAFHISSGITILALTLVRIVWRLTHPRPPMLPMPAWQKGLAHLVHFLLYLAMLAAPLTGWAIVSAHPDKPAPPAAAGQAPKPAGPMVWGLFPLPKLAPIKHIADEPNGLVKIKQAHDLFDKRHLALGYLFLGLLLLHIGGALKHQWIDKERELARMGISRRGRARWAAVK